MDEDPTPTDGDAIRRLREARGLSQEQLALRAGVSTLTVGRIERGANASPQNAQQDRPRASGGRLGVRRSGAAAGL